MEVTACSCPGRSPNSAFPVKCSLALPSVGEGVTAKSHGTRGFWEALLLCHWGQWAPGTQGSQGPSCVRPLSLYGKSLKAILENQQQQKIILVQATSTQVYVYMVLGHTMPVVVAWVSVVPAYIRLRGLGIWLYQCYTQEGSSKPEQIGHLAPRAQAPLAPWGSMGLPDPTVDGKM